MKLKAAVLIMGNFFMAGFNTRIALEKPIFWLPAVLCFITGCVIIYISDPHPAADNESQRG